MVILTACLRLLGTIFTVNYSENLPQSPSSLKLNLVLDHPTLKPSSKKKLRTVASTYMTTRQPTHSLPRLRLSICRCGVRES